MSALTVLLNIVLEVPLGATWQEKGRNADWGKKEVKLSLFADSLVVYVEDKEIYKKELEKVRVRLQDTRSLYKTQSYSIIVVKKWKFKFKKQYHPKILNIHG